MEVENWERAIELVEKLVYWSENFQAPTPFTLYLDLIGYSESEYGGNLIARGNDYENAIRKLSFVELDAIGAALVAFATYPTEVNEWIRNYENGDQGE